MEESRTAVGAALLGNAAIIHRLPLEDAPAAHELFAGKLDGCVKCVLRPAA
jgi:hypothetical protein